MVKTLGNTNGSLPPLNTCSPAVGVAHRCIAIVRACPWTCWSALLVPTGLGKSYLCRTKVQRLSIWISLALGQLQSIHNPAHFIRKPLLLNIFYNTKIFAMFTKWNDIFIIYLSIYPRFYKGMKFKRGVNKSRGVAIKLHLKTPVRSRHLDFHNHTRTIGSRQARYAR